MHYFEMPRLGAYAAFPLVYPTYYTQEAHAEEDEFELDASEVSVDDVVARRIRIDSASANAKPGTGKANYFGVFFKPAIAKQRSMFN